MRWTLALCLALLWAAGALAAPDEDPPTKAAFSDALLPLLTEYCVVCHAGPMAQGSLDLSRFGPDTDLAAEARLWTNVRGRLARGEMPPPGLARPDDEAVAGAVAWLDATLPGASTTRSRPPTQRRVTARRLNRREYEHSIRDLVGVAFRTDTNFPADDVGYGFDNIGDVLSLPPVLLEKYLLAAEAIAERAVVDEQDGEPPARRYAGRALTVEGGGNLAGRGPWILSSTAEVGASHEVEHGGTYRLRVRAYGQQAGPEAAKMAFRAGGRSIETVEVEAERGAPGLYEADVALTPGKHRLGAAFVNDYYKPDHPDPKQRDRNLAVFFLEVVGPLTPPTLPPFQRQLVPASLEPSEEAEALRGSLAWLARRAWRRPVVNEELDRLVATVERAVGGEDARFEAKVRIGVTAILVSPHFLYRWELGGTDAREAGRALTDHELASRLSFFLWSSTPDDELLNLADAGRLREEAVLDKQVRRMLRDARATTLATGFARQWLHIGALAEVHPDATLFPGVDEALRDAMRAETLALFEAILREERDVRELLTADFTFVNDRLARHYGLPDVVGSQMRRVPLPPSGRRGLLGHASVLTSTSNPDRTSPVKRGKWILEALLDAPPPPPPPGAGTLDESQGALSPTSLREQLEIHRRDPTCAVCHDVMDPLGFALENYDAVGRWRARDGETPIDAGGSLPDGRRLEGARSLTEVLAGDGAYLRSMARHLLTYALGRGLDAEDDAATGALVAALEREPTFSQLVRAIVRLPVFRTRMPTATEKP